MRSRPERKQAMAKATVETAEIKVQPLKRATAKLRIIGTTALFQNRMSA